MRGSDHSTRQTAVVAVLVAAGAVAFALVGGDARGQSGASGAPARPHILPSYPGRPTPAHPPVRDAGPTAGGAGDAATAAEAGLSPDGGDGHAPGDAVVAPEDGPLAGREAELLALERRLDARELEFQARIAEVEAREAEVWRRLEEVRARGAAGPGGSDAKAELPDGLEHLVAITKKMKPAAAAEIARRWSTRLAVQVFIRLPARIDAPILGAMPPEDATRITRAIAGELGEPGGERDG